MSSDFVSFEICPQNNVVESPNISSALSVTYGQQVKVIAYILLEYHCLTVLH